MSIDISRPWARTSPTAASQAGGYFTVANKAREADRLIAAESPAASKIEIHGIKVVGVDYLSVEVFKTPGAPAHHTLLGGGAIVIEGLNLRDVEPGVYDMLCLPLRIVGADGAPARVILRRN